jgi:hypothetical protein
MKKLTLFITLGLVFTSTLKGYDYNDNAPLRPCSWSFSERGGVEPGYFPYRQKNQVKNVVGLAEAFVIIDDILPIIDLFEVEETLIIQNESKRAPAFSDQFDIPWMAGGELAYAMSCNTEIFVDGSYTGAHGKSDSYTVFFSELPGVLDADPPFETPTDLQPAVSVNIREKYSDLESYGAHLGFRYHFPILCNRVSFFTGAKVGFKHWDTIKAKVEATFIDEVNGEVEIDAGKFTYYPSSTVISGGFQVGLLFHITKCFSIQITGEAVGTGGFKFGNDVEIPRGEVNRIEEIGIDSIIRVADNTLIVPVRRTGTLMTFPVHVGIRLTF